MAVYLNASNIAAALEEIVANNLTVCITKDEATEEVTCWIVPNNKSVNIKFWGASRTVEGAFLGAVNDMISQVAPGNIGVGGVYREVRGL